MDALSCGGLACTRCARIPRAPSCFVLVSRSNFALYFSLSLTAKVDPAPAPRRARDQSVTPDQQAPTRVELTRSREVATRYRAITHEAGNLLPNRLSSCFPVALWGTSRSGDGSSVIRR